jgi:hypothetical protein
VASFDLLDDVNQKFVNTIIMYDKKALLVKGAILAPAGEFIIQAVGYNTKTLTHINLKDPVLNYTNYNIGYCNGGQYAAWWYRQPHKQWSQGLKHNQMGWVLSAPNTIVHDAFNFSRPFINMLEGIYPDIETVKKSLIDQQVGALAFHKDFALSYDTIHDDFVLEYHGTKIGASIDRELKQFKIMPEARHLIEALQEARNAYA